METFTWLVDVGSSPELVFRNKEIQYGNGYAASVGDGLNTNSENWVISIFGLRAKVKPAYDFIKAHAGRRAFTWVTPFGETIQVKATEVKMPSNGADTYTLSAKFTQSFTPT